jgi:hypothetical protein
LLGQFHTPDPLYLADPARCIASPVACNLYSYAANNPLLFVDPTGYDAWRWIKETAVSAGRYGADVARGVGAGAWDTGEGVYTMVRHPVQTAEGIAHAVWHPVETSLVVWDALEDTARAVAQGDPEIIGRVLFEAGVAVASGGVASGVGKIDKLADAAGMADKAGDAAKFAARGTTRALPAPRQIEAAWGASRYRHGGLMTGMEHIMYRHSTSSGFANVSRFAEGTTARNIMDHVDDALRYGRVTQTGPGAFTVEHSLGLTIGTNVAGEAASSIRVYLRDGIIQTAFPF